MIDQIQHIPETKQGKPTAFGFSRIMLSGMESNQLLGTGNMAATRRRAEPESQLRSGNDLEQKEGVQLDELQSCERKNNCIAKAAILPTTARPLSTIFMSPASLIRSRKMGTTFQLPLPSHLRTE